MAPDLELLAQVFFLQVSILQVFIYYHLMYFISKIAAPTTRAVSMPKQASISPDITYHGNRSVMVGQVNLYNIYVGAFSNLADPSASLVNYFASNIGNTSWFGILPKHYYQYKNKVKKYISSTGPKFKKGIYTCEHVNI